MKYRVIFNEMDDLSKIYTPNSIRLASSQEEQGKHRNCYDGFIEKRRKRSIDFRVKDKLYTVNTHGVLCSRRIQDDGKTWYSFCCSSDELFGKLSEDREFAELLSIGRDAKGLIFR